MSPVTDLTLSSPSLSTNDGLDLISRAVLEQACTQYLAGARADCAPQSPLHGDLAGLPDLLLVAGAGGGPGRRRPGIRRCCHRRRNGH